LVEPFASRVPQDKHVAFITDLWAHGASYGVGLIGGTILCALTVQRRRLEKERLDKQRREQQRSTPTAQENLGQEQQRPETEPQDDDASG